MTTQQDVCKQPGIDPCTIRSLQPNNCQHAGCIQPEADFQEQVLRVGVAGRLIRLAQSKGSRFAFALQMFSTLSQGDARTVDISGQSLSRDQVNVGGTSEYTSEFQLQGLFEQCANHAKFCSVLTNPQPGVRAISKELQ